MFNFLRKVKKFILTTDDTTPSSEQRKVKIVEHKSSAKLPVNAKVKVEMKKSSPKEMKQAELLLIFGAKIREDEKNDYFPRTKLNRSACDSRKAILVQLTLETLKQNAEMLFDLYQPYNRIINALLRRGIKPTMKQRKTLFAQSVNRLNLTNGSEWELIDHLMRIGFTIGSSIEDIKFASKLVETMTRNYRHYPYAYKTVALIEYIIDIACPPLLLSTELWKRIFYDLSVGLDGKTCESDLALTTLLLQRNDDHFFNCCRWLIANCIVRMVLSHDTNRTRQFLSTIEAVFSIIGHQSKLTESCKFASELQRQAYFTGINSRNPIVEKIFKNHPVIGLIDREKQELTPTAIPTITFPEDKMIIPVELGRLKLLQTWALFTCPYGLAFDFNVAKSQVYRTTNVFTTIYPRQIDQIDQTSQVANLEKEKRHKGEDNLFTLFLSGADLSEQIDAEKYLPRLRTRKAKLVEHLLPCVNFIPPLVGLILDYH